MPKRTLIIGDIHGCSETFSKMLNEKLKVTKEDDIYLLGDYIDRGPNVKETIDIILDLKDNGYHIFALMGNHEQMLLNSIYSVEEFAAWYKNNGAAMTLKSFGVKYPKMIEQKYLDFFYSLEYYFELDKFIIVHGGLNFEIDNPLEDIASMVWIREEHVDRKKTHGKRLITGHTPRPIEEIKKSLMRGKILLDGGCVYYRKYKDMGNLVALELETMKLFVQRNIDF